MKSFFLFVACFLGTSVFAQINFNPYSNHYDIPYTVTVSGNGTLYYTTDGSQPTMSSTSAINNFNVFIDQNKTINVFLVDSQGNSSAIETIKYYTGNLPQAKIFFLPPTTWTSVCTMPYMIDPNSMNGLIIDPIFPGPQMTATGCQNWYKYEGFLSQYEEGSVYFNNCALSQGIPGSIETSSFIVGDVIYYDFSNGIITNPPACLLSTKESSKKVTLVKILENPVENFVSLNTDLSLENYTILSADGRQIKRGTMRSNQIDVSSLINGSYFLVFDSEDGQNIMVKFIKK